MGTKQWCKEDIISSFNASKRVIIVDNANLAKWEYGEYIVKYAQMYRYKVLIVEIQSECPSHSRHGHIAHMNANEDISDCLLCAFQHHRCKMRINGKIYSKFIQKYQEDTNAIIVQPKLEKIQNGQNWKLQK